MAMSTVDPEVVHYLVARAAELRAMAEEADSSQLAPGQPDEKDYQ